MKPVPMSPRLLTIAVHMPAHVSDQEAADSIYRILRHAMVPRSPAHTYPDGKSLEVHAATLTADQDEELRRELFPQTEEK